ncbi:MAG: hypothetical protein FWC10_09395 [Lentimicrobiaceae bacterium]|nr:hypothetical protein [Lentimicrobiaceae bacterium]
MTNLKHRLAELKLETQDDLNTLNDILDGVKDADYPKELIVPLLHVLENNPNFHFGAPGNIVRVIEKISMQQFTDEEYFDLLIQSVERVPTEYNLWLMNRIMNTSEDENQIKKGLTVFHKVKQEVTDDGLRDLTQEFIENFDE